MEKSQPAIFGNFGLGANIEEKNGRRHFAQDLPGGSHSSVPLQGNAEEIKGMFFLQ
jgi:hypothetical protein